MKTITVILRSTSNFINMREKNLGYDDAYSLKTPEDSIKLYNNVGTNL